ncbi:hypothetical protein HYPSUDRAFT_204030 [Hypholoma sublateritium FD-334 SS-4]|uniref:Uncharacterized protein n=1 Tax=Hypholoma sublateritium (strain FD-334 SS-4) TaxID=945553 RepID=A0A0D2M9Z0_HYPSF|nr:hypothetical protein HYPSUDRAFT_204030 [Hypholoma sublateritium FD-334 SS-4]
MTNKVYRCAASASDDPRPPRVTFEYIHAPLVEAREEIRDSRTSIRNIEDINERITRGKAFPYPYVDVCRHWASVILGVPHFWTNAIVFIGPLEMVYGKHLGGAETIFSASRTLPFDVTIRSTKLDPKLDPAGYFSALGWSDLEREQADIVRILGLLAPHLYRCRSLSLYTILVGAMPLVYRHLDGPAPLLKMLMLQTDNINDRYRKSSFDAELKLPPDFSPVASAFAPPLEQLIVDGIGFRDVHKHHAGICETYGAHLVSLALVNYVADEWDNGYSPLGASAMAHALAPFVHLDALKLSCVRLDYGVDADTLGPTQLGVRTLFLERMDTYSLEQLFDAVTFPELEDLWFKACWPAVQGENEYNPAYLPSDVPLLTLESIADVDLARALCHWDVQAIRACGALAFDDAVLDMLGAPRDAAIAEADITQTTEFVCDTLHVLLIIAAPGISTAGLKRMVASRNRWVDYADPMWRTSAPVGPTIQDITLLQLPSQMVFTAEDEAWFHAHVAQFQFQWIVDENLKNEDSELGFL